MGRGDWYRFDTKPRAEDCLGLCVNYMNRCGLLDEGMEGRLWWTRHGSEIAAIGYRTAGGVLTLDYAFRDEPVTIPVRLTYTTPNYGGRRPWFVCPLAVGDVPCGRRVGKLYGRGRLFGCRHCHDLSYESAQEAHAGERLFAACGLDPRGAKWMEQDARDRERERHRRLHREQRAERAARRRRAGGG